MYICYNGRGITIRRDDNNEKIGGMAKDRGNRDASEYNQQSEQKHDYGLGDAQLAALIGNQAMLSKREITSLPVVQRVSPVGEEISNYYVQKKNGNIKSVSQATYDNSTLPRTEEPGYTTFESHEQASDYSPVFLTEEFDEESGHYIYTKKAGIDLPISCVESAAWAMRAMDEENPKSYPGYMSFDDAFYEAMDVVDAQIEAEDLEKISANYERISEIIEEMLPKIHFDPAKYEGNSMALIRRATWVYFFGAVEDGFSIERCAISKYIINQLEVYTDDFVVGEGILIADTSSKDGEDAELHALAIVATFGPPDGGFIVLERNAGSTEIASGHIGDDNWLLNYYESADDFKQKTQENPENFKTFLLQKEFVNMDDTSDDTSKLAMCE